MRVDKFTQKSAEAFQAAQALANEQGHSEISPEHLLVTLAQQEDGVVPPILGAMGIRPDYISGQALAALQSLPFRVRSFASPPARTARTR